VVAITAVVVPLAVRTYRRTVSWACFKSHSHSLIAATRTVAA
jgi:hypothetical protein